MVQNLAVGAQAADGYILGFSTTPSRTNSTAYIGTIAGRNEGIIANCAAEGYSMQAYTYNSTTLYAGGLVGYNNKTIQNCSAVTAGYDVQTNSSNASVGSFTGTNGGSGVITGSYSIGSLNVKRYTSGTVRVGGFSGRNSGTIANCYTATAITTSNIGSAYVDGFAPAGGSVRSCYYLNGGTYKYLGTPYTYDQTTKSAAAPKTYEELKTVRPAGFAAAADSEYHGSTSTGDAVNGQAYPFATSVKSMPGATHFGDWPTTDVLGSFGILYWEHEEKGSNNGYHFYLLDENGKPFSTLCEAHDDGGVVTSYGYGWFKLGTFRISGSPSFSNDVDVGGRNNTAEQAFADQFAGAYHFELYTTSNAFADSPSGLFLNGTTKYGKLAITAGGQAYSYYFNPFFAAAISMKPGDLGGSSVPFQIRSIHQLQFINWNNASRKNTEKVTSSNYQKFSFLPHANGHTGTYEMKDTTMGNADAASMVWKQSHDIDLQGSSAGFTPIAAAATSSSGSYNAVLYSWFGGTYDGQSYKIQELSITSDAFAVGLFGTTAGAQIKNMILYSEKNAVIQRSAASNSTEGGYSLGGLIGVAYNFDSSAAIENCAIAGYRIEDNSHNKQTLGESNVGGLIGVANVNLKQCSAVVDIWINCTHGNTSSITTATYGNFIRVGGVAGATQGSLTDCYSGGSVAVSDAVLDENFNSKGGAHVSQNNSNGVVDYAGSTNIYISGIGGSAFTMNYQNFSGTTGSKDGVPSFTNCYTYMDFPKLKGTIRTISLIGSLADRYQYGNQVTITNCYYLGSIINKDDMLSEMPSFNYTSGYKANGGISALIKGDSTVRVTIDGTTYDLTYFEHMIYGTSVYPNKMLLNSDTLKCNRLQLTEVDYFELMELSGQLGGNWGKVTTRENGTAINGKYSFPGSAYGLKGLNFPFPTVIRQNDSFGNRVNVHYGEWPKNTGLYVKDGTVELDLLVPYDAADPDKIADVFYTTAGFWLDNKQVAMTDLENNLKVELIVDTSELDEEDATAVAPNVAKVTTELDAATGEAKLTILGLTEGSTTVRLTYKNGTQEYTAEIQVTVTAEFSITVEHVDPVLDANGNITDVTANSNEAEAFQEDYMYWRLKAFNSEGTEIDLDITNWKVEGVEEDAWSASGGIKHGETNTEDYDIFQVGTDNILRVSSIKVGEHESVQVTAYDLTGVTNSDEQKVSGSRTTEISFNVIQNPSSVYIYQYPQGTENNPYMVIYQGINSNGEVTYFTNKLCTDPISQIEKTWWTTDLAEGYEVFHGFYTDDDTEFAYFNPDDNLDYAPITYTRTIPEGGMLYAYGQWGLKEYTITYTSDYGVEVSEPVKYDVENRGGVKIAPLPEDVTVGDKTYHCYAWAVAADAGTWTADTEYKGNAAVPVGMTGDVTLKALWTEIYTITYQVKDSAGNAVKDSDGNDVVYTASYTAQDESIVLHAAIESTEEGKGFAGWKIAPECDITDTAVFKGWDGSKLYKADALTIANAKGNYTGSITMVPVWSQAYTITYYDNDGTTELGSQTYFREYDSITLSEFTKNGYAFTKWTVGETGADVDGWTAGTEYAANALTVTTGNAYAGNVKMTADWSLVDYTITYEANGGQYGISSETYNYETEMHFTNNGPTRVYYEFAYWEITSNDGNWKEVFAPQGGKVYSGPNNTFTRKNLYGDVVLTASWNPLKYTITYVDPTGAKLFADEVNEYTIESAITFKDLPAGYDADVYGWTVKTLPETHNNGWKLTDEFGAGETIAAGRTGNVTVQIAEQNAVIYMEGADHSKITRVTYTTTAEDHNETFAAPTVLVKLFQNWKVTAKTGTWDTVPDTEYAANQTFNTNGRTGNLTLEAVYRAAHKLTLMNGTTKYAEYTENGETGLAEGIPNEGVGTPTAPDGKEFTGWFTAETGGDKVDDPAAVDLSKDNVTLYAQFGLKTYHISYTYADGTAVGTPVTEYKMDSTAKLIGAQKTGYHFDGWMATLESGTGSWVTGTVYPADTSLTGMFGDVSLVAQWTIETYTISYGNLHGGSVSDGAPTTYTILSTDVLPTASSNGYTFDNKWKVSSATAGGWTNGDQHDAGTAAMNGKTGNVTLDAQWTPITYTITYQNFDGSAMGTETYTIESGSVLKTPTRVGYDFVKWTVISENEGNWTKDTKHDANEALNGQYGNVTLQASWKIIDYSIRYTVGANGKLPNGTKNPLSYNIETPDFSLASATPNTGYSFDGWSVKTTNGTDNATKWTGTIPASNLTITKGSKTGNVELEAVINAITYTITYDTQGGSAVASQTYTINDAITFGTSTKTGYTFNGWKIQAHTNADNWSATTTYNGNVAKGRYGSVTLVAQWTPITYNISYRITNGTTSGTRQTTYTIEKGITLPTVTPKDGFTFVGWKVFDTSTGNWSTMTGNYTGTIEAGKYGDVTFQAVWKQKKTAYKLTEATTTTLTNGSNYIIASGNNGTVYLAGLQNAYNTGVVSTKIQYGYDVNKNEIIYIDTNDFPSNNYTWTYYSGDNNLKCNQQLSYTGIAKHDFYLGHANNGGNLAPSMPDNNAGGYRRNWQFDSSSHNLQYTTNNNTTYYLTVKNNGLGTTTAKADAGSVYVYSYSQAEVITYVYD